MNRRLTAATEALGNGGTTTAIYRISLGTFTILFGIISTMVWRGIDDIKSELHAATSAISAVRVQQSRDTTGLSLLKEQMDREITLLDKEIDDHEKRIRVLERSRRFMVP